MSNEESNLDDILGNFESEIEDVSEHEAVLLNTLVTDLAVETATPEEGEEAAPKETKTSTVVPDSEEDFINKIGSTQDEPIDDDTDDRDDSHDGKAPIQSDDEDDTSVYFKAVAEGLLKLGKFDGMEVPEKWDPDTFISFYDEYTEAKVSTGIEERISDKWGEDGIKMFNDIFVKGVNPKDYFEKYNDIVDIDSIDLDSATNQKLVVSKYLEALGQDEEEILDQIEVLEEKGKLAERSEKYKEKLVEDSKRELARMTHEKEVAATEAKNAQLARTNAIKEVVNKAITAKEINGIPLSVNDSKELLSFATDLNWKLANGTLITDADKAILDIKKDPEKWVALSKLLKEGLNIAPIKNKGAAEKSEQVFNFKATKKVKADNKNNPLDLFLKKTKF